MNGERYHDLDAVRAAAMLLGIVLHVCIFFMPSSRLFWGAGEYHGDIINLQLLSFIHLFRMELFFLLAGFFAELVASRKGFPHLVKDRLKRIGIPFCAGVLLVMPLHKLLMHGYGNYYSTFMNKSLVDQLLAVIPFGLCDDAEGLNDGLIHYWFMFYLLLLYSGHFAVRWAAGLLRIEVPEIVHRAVRACLSTPWGILILAGTVWPLQYLLVDIFLPPSGFNAPVIDVLLYGMYYAFGALLYENRESLKDIAKHGPVFLIGAAVFIPFIDEATVRINTSAPVVQDITTWTVFDTQGISFCMPEIHWEGIVFGGTDRILVSGLRSLLCWLLCLGFIGCARRVLSQPNPLIRYFADSAYWVYWVHMPLTFKLSYLGQQLPSVPSLFKCYAICVVSTIIVYASYNYCVRYSFLGDYFMGRRKDRDAEGEEAFRVMALLRKCMPGVVLGGVLAYLLGCVLDYNNKGQGSEAIVEAYVTRDRDTIKGLDSITGITDEYGNTPLHAAAKRPEAKRLYDPLPLLVEKATDVDVKNQFGRTPLFVAVRTGNEADVAQLLEAGADPNIADFYGHTPAHVAAIKSGGRAMSSRSQYERITTLLAQHGADLTLTDKRGRTVEDCSAQFNTSGR